MMIVRIAVGILAMAQLAMAQSQASPQLEMQVRHQLDSTETRTAAWGAYSAGVYHVTSAIPRLELILASPPSAPDIDRAALTDAILDALVQLEAQVPARMLVPYLERRSVQALVLLASAHDRNSTLVSLLPKTTGLRWYAVANMLLRDDKGGLAADLLSTLTLHLDISVTDDEGIFVYGSGGCGWCGDGIGVSPPEYPPRALYRITSSALSDVAVLADGPRPVYYSRRLVTETQYGFGECGVCGPDDDDRIKYLKAIHGLTDRAAPSAQTSGSVRWSTSEEFLEKVGELRVGLERDYDALIRALLDAGAITGEAAAASPPRIDIRVMDARHDRSVPLPSLPDTR